MRIFAAIMGGLAGAFLTHMAQLSMKAFPRAFNEEALRTKAALGFMIGVGWIIRMIFWGSFCPMCAAISLIAGPILGIVLLSAAHFLGEMLWETVTDIWSVARSYFTSIGETIHVTN